jgi:D-glycero-beta-D-manno-heptose 1-phosphate adenylyltransferase
VVTTNGCFDVLHVGHLRYLEAASEVGDVLVVLLNSDDSVRQIKGPRRPIVPEEERAEMLAGLACVDYVAIFHKDTPIELLERIRPNVHVKGDEYSAASLPEATVLEGMGTELAFIPMVPGRSTTNIIQRIVEASQQTV